MSGSICADTSVQIRNPTKRLNDSLFQNVNKSEGQNSSRWRREMDYSCRH